MRILYFPWTKVYNRYTQIRIVRNTVEAKNDTREAYYPDS